MDDRTHAHARRLTRRRALSLTAALAVAPVAATACTETGGSPEPAEPSGSPEPEPPEVTAAPADGVLSANLNQNLDMLHFDELRHVGATWVRGFYRVRASDETDPAEDLAPLSAAADAGYGTVLSLKFKYRNGLPRPGSARMRQLLRRVDRVLEASLDTMSIVVVGNEPFLECRERDRENGAINRFYEAVTAHVLDYRREACGEDCRTEIYLGALNNLEDPAERTPQVARWLEFVRDTPELAGTDCHPHVASLAEGRRYLDYILPRIGQHQKFLATEFSLIKLYRRHLRDRVASGYAERAGLPPDTRVWQRLRAFLQRPGTQQEWMEFLSSCPWYADNGRFLTDMLAAFRRSGRCAVASYGITQDDAMSRDFGPDSSPWLLNSVFCPRTVRSGPDGLPGRNELWTEQFRAAQRR